MFQIQFEELTVVNSFSDNGGVSEIGCAYPGCSTCGMTQ
jgi:hypothetical protein